MQSHWYKPFSSECTASLYVPRVIFDPCESKLLGDLSGCHRSTHVLLVGVDQQCGFPQVLHHTTNATLSALFYCRCKSRLLLLAVFRSGSDLMSILIFFFLLLFFFLLRRPLQESYVYGGSDRIRIKFGRVFFNLHTYHIISSRFTMVPPIHSSEVRYNI